MRTIWSTVLALVVLCQFSAQGMEVGRLKSSRELLTSGGRSNWGKPQKSRNPDRLAAGERVLVLFHQDGLVGVIASRVKEYPTRGNEFASQEWVAGYLPEDAVVSEYPAAVDFATLHDKEGEVNVRSGPGNDQPVLTTLKTAPKKDWRNAVFLLDRQEWSKVVTPSGQIGYIHRSRLRPWHIDVGDDPDKRALAEALLLPDMRKKQDGSHIVRWEAFCGCDHYYGKPGTQKIEHNYRLGASCRYGNWAHVVVEARDPGGNWVFFGGVPTHLMERVEGKWIERGQAYDDMVKPKVLPEDVRRAFSLNLMPESYR